MTRDATRPLPEPSCHGARIPNGPKHTFAPDDFDRRRAWGFADDFGIDDWVPLAVQDPRFFRFAEVDRHMSDADLEAE